MHPLIHIPFVGSVHAHVALVTLAVVVSFPLGVWLCWKLEHLHPQPVIVAFVVIGMGAFVGARLHYVINYLGAYASRPWLALTAWPSGLHAAGGLLGVMLTTPIACCVLRLPTARVADSLVPAAAVGIALARIGCFLQGCCYGTPCAFPWCVAFPRQLDPVHPLQLYFAGATAAFVPLALWLFARRRYPGQVALVCALGFTILLAVLESWRFDGQGRVYWGPLPQLQWMAIALTMAVGTILARAERRCRRDARASVWASASTSSS